VYVWIQASFCFTLVEVSRHNVSLCGSEVPIYPQSMCDNSNMNDGCGLMNNRFTGPTSFGETTRTGDTIPLACWKNWPSHNWRICSLWFPTKSMLPAPYTRFCSFENHSARSPMVELGVTEQSLGHCLRQMFRLWVYFIAISQGPSVCQPCARPSNPHLWRHYRSHSKHVGWRVWRR
jgi:hypothetical protein